MAMLGKTSKEVQDLSLTGEQKQRGLIEKGNKGKGWGLAELGALAYLIGQTLV